jgi:hypothetical protein
MANYFISLDKPANQNPVSTVSNTTPDGDIFFVYGDVVPITIQFLKNNSVDTTTYVVTGSASSSFFLGIGALGSNQPYVSTNKFFISQSYGITGSLAISSSALLSALGTSDSLTSYIQLSVFKPSGSVNRETKMLKKVTILNPIDL